jgi:ankyrin repeat protein
MVTTAQKYEFSGAAAKGNLDSMKALLREHGNELLQGASKIGSSPLHGAARAGKLDAVKFLVEHGSPLDSASFAGSPLYLAAWGGHVEVVTYLVSARAEIDRVGDGGTALMGSMQGGHFDVARLLLDLGAKVRVETDVAQELLVFRPDGSDGSADAGDAGIWVRDNDSVEGFLLLMSRQLLPITPPGAALDWVVGAGETDVTSLVNACLGDPELCVDLTDERIGSYIEKSGHESVKAVFRSELVHRSVVEGMATVDSDPVPRRSSAGPTL